MKHLNGSFFSHTRLKRNSYLSFIFQCRVQNYSRKIHIAIGTYQHTTSSTYKVWWSFYKIQTGYPNKLNKCEYCLLACPQHDRSAGIREIGKGRVCRVTSAERGTPVRFNFDVVSSVVMRFVIRWNFIPATQINVQSSTSVKQIANTFDF